MNIYYSIGNNANETSSSNGTNSNNNNLTNSTQQQVPLIGTATATTSNTPNRNSSMATQNINTNNSVTLPGSNPTHNNMWDNDALENDDFDSDQLDEDESYSWASGITDNQDGIGGGGVGGSNLNNGAANCSTSIANWRGWRGGSISQSNSLNILTNTTANSNNSTLVANVNDFNTFNNSLLSNRSVNHLPPPPVNLMEMGNILNQNRSSKKQARNEKQLDKLVDICAKYVANNIPFELVESFPQPVPEELQLKITHASFPDNIDNIRLYSCLANGHVDEYLRGEQLYHNRCVRKVIQIGFHLSAQVVITSPLGMNGNGNTTNTTTSINHQSSNINSHFSVRSNSLNNNNLFNFFVNGNSGCNVNNNCGNGASSLFASVAIVCDRKRIVTCTCTCSKQSIPWCSHIVAVCLFRILEPNQVEYRAPVSESLSKLHRDQLQKFAQYLISELPQQILPTAQKLLDELLKSNDSSINVLSGAPDPTAGASKNDISVWCLDECILQENIHKTLLKFIVPTPNVVSDIECLEHASSATAAEYTSLLRPLRGKEPEGMWNLISIIREMFRRRDKNSIPLLRIITHECLGIDQIVQLWFLVRTSQLYHDKALFNSVSTNLLGRNSSSSNNSNNNSNLTPPVHQACSSLMDEIVSLWRIACLNPLIDDINEKYRYKEQLTIWHSNLFERLRKFCTGILSNSNNNNNNNYWSASNQQNNSGSSSNQNSSTNIEKLFKRLDIDSFSGFLPALNACEMSWSNFDLYSPIHFRHQFKNLLMSRLLLQQQLQQQQQQQQQQQTQQQQIQQSLITSNDNSPVSSQLTVNASVNKNEEVNSSLTASNFNKPLANTNQEDLLSLYSFDYDPSKMKKASTIQPISKEDELLKFKLKSNLEIKDDTNPFEVLFSRCEALFAHGFTEQACIVAQILADHMLEKNSPSTPLISMFNTKMSNDNGELIIPVNDDLSCKTQMNTQSSVIKPSGANYLRQKCVNNFQNTILWRSYLLCYILNESAIQLKSYDSYNSNQNTPDSSENKFLEKKTSKLNQLAFRIGIFGLETPRLPAISKALEVKLINQEQELVNLLKRLQIGTYELNLLRERAIKLRDVGPAFMKLQRTKNSYYTIPIMLASFIFDVLNNYGSSQLLQAQPQVENENSTSISVTQTSTSINEDQQLAFESSVAVLDMKVNISESQHSLLCEGIRRQKGDLALTLLLTYKDDETRLLKIMEKILDRDIHVLFKQCSSSLVQFNPFNPNLKKIQQQQLQEYNLLIGSNVINNNSYMNNQHINDQSKVQQQTLIDSKQPIVQSKINDQKPSIPAASCLLTSNLSNSLNPSSAMKSSLTSSTKQTALTAIDSLSSGWEESENESPNVSNEISLLETKYRCLNLIKTQQQQQNVQSNLDQNQQLQASSTKRDTTSSDNSPTLTRKQTVLASNSNNTTSSNNPPVATIPTINTLKKNKSIDDSGDDSGESSSSVDNNSNESANKAKQIPFVCNLENKNLNTTADVATSNLNFDPLATLTKSNKSENNNKPNLLLNTKLSYNSLMNQVTNLPTRQQSQGQQHQISHPPSEALAHYMFEFSKTVLSKAGGSVSTSIFLNHQNNHQPAGPHRNLHICSFLISLYALGLHNCVQASWLSRTYSSHVTWVNSQAVDIGFPAICILIESWQGHLTPSECVSLADRVSRGRDNMAVKAAAELALSSLKFSHLMNLNEIQRALIQCKEQSTDMLQRACVIVENSVKDANGNNLLEILFTVAKRWDELFIESLNQQQQSQPMAQSNPTSSSTLNTLEINNLIQPPPFIQPIYTQQQAQQSPAAMVNPAAAIYASYLSNQTNQSNINTNNPYNYQLNQFQQQQQQQFQLQNLLRQQQLHQQPQIQQQHQQILNNNFVPAQIENLDPTSLNHLTSAFRVGMLGLEALPRRVDGSHQIKYRQSPSYADDVKWLWQVAIKLDSHMKTNGCLQQFCQTAASVIQNPFLIQELAFDSANYLSRTNPSQFSLILCSPILNVLVQRCLNLYFRCCMSKLHHLNQNEHEDFINMLLTARNIFFYSGNMNCFSDLINNLRRSNKCKKEIWNKICNALNNHN